MKTRLVVCRIFLALVFAACLCGCESAPPPLYSWGSYETQVYAYFKGESREAQIATLERDLGKTEAGGKAVPPGFYAHLGLLYVETGNDAKAIACFQAEKARFPEAAAFMDLLLGRYGKQ
jgi:hypothetical protein